MDFARASLELQAGLLPATMLRKFACDAIVEGHDGTVIRQLAAQLGEPPRELDQLIASIPNIEQELITEARLPARTPEQARWEISREIIRTVVDGNVRPREGAFALTRLAQDVEDPRLSQETRTLLRIVDQWEWDDPGTQDQMEADMMAEIRRLALLT